MAYNHLADPDPELAPLLAAWPPAPDAFLADIPKARQYFNTGYLAHTRRSLKKSLPPDGALCVEDRQIEVDGGKIPIRCYRPVADGDSDKTFPLFIWLHGGGYTFHSIKTDDYALRILCASLQLAIVNVGYRLAPEHPWPVPLDDCYAAVKWASSNSIAVHGDVGKGFIVGGSSAGAHMAGAIAHRVRADPFFVNQSKPTGQFLQIPPIVHGDAVPEGYKANFTSLVHNREAPMLTTKQLYEFYRLVQAPPFDPEFSPLLQPFESFKGLPPAYMQVCGLDPARDMGMLYAEKLKAAGVPTRLDTYTGAPHNFHSVFPETRLAKKFSSDVGKGMKWLLSQPRRPA
ncbi:AB hydrolase superfamily protein B1A11.02 [Trametes pubescens]|uniref:AB hydrolase superfamily protein B1A11.02 n=1 Tax=Trametes pubescens TaxID=154538 RepID=A0A1M2V6F8_TRAPU|nr:AB hydrolase superfamily protein B1A11.02 [Trametes pubescens]